MVTNLLGETGGGGSQIQNTTSEKKFKKDHLQAKKHTIVIYYTGL